MKTIGKRGTGRGTPEGFNWLVRCFFCYRFAQGFTEKYREQNCFLVSDP